MLAPPQDEGDGLVGDGPAVGLHRGQQRLDRLLDPRQRTTTHRRPGVISMRELAAPLPDAAAHLLLGGAAQPPDAAEPELVHADRLAHGDLVHGGEAAQSAGGQARLGQGGIQLHGVSQIVRALGGRRRRLPEDAAPGRAHRAHGVEAAGGIASQGPGEEIGQEALDAAREGLPAQRHLIGDGAGIGLGVTVVGASAGGHLVEDHRGRIALSGRIVDGAVEVGPEERVQVGRGAGSHIRSGGTAQ